ncbi:hypothetical protein [Pseudomonas sp. UBA1879]|uniref:hypothetical protein n=1 Tax=Pseudomonas sp. UBA1879 TaxID=1947305 RepID=UPI0026002E13|nr:hypothetical protein [Pseudomonas sp. UBA1879]
MRQSIVLYEMSCCPTDGNSLQRAALLGKWGMLAVFNICKYGLHMTFTLHIARHGALANTTG